LFAAVCTCKAGEAPALKDRRSALLGHALLQATIANERRTPTIVRRQPLRIVD